VPLDDPLVIALIALAVIIICGAIVFLAVRAHRRKKESTSEEREQSLQAPLAGLPFKVVKSVPRDDATHAKDELRILDLEREILSDAIRRLYEAQAEGKITEQERERLAQTYKSRMMTVKEAISKDESLVALHELETMQEDLIKLFSERFDQLTGKIDELRTKVETKPIREIAIPMSRPMPDDMEEKPSDEEKARRKKKQAQAKTSPRTEAEKRIEEIKAEVEKVLDRLGQMEIDG
jgi:hypothetical protein